MKFLFKPFYILMIAVFVLTMFTNISFGEPYEVKHDVMRDAFVSREIDNLAESGNDQDNFHSQNGKHFIRMAKKNKPMTESDAPFCCYQTKVEIDEKIDKLKKSIKNLRACKGKKRDKTCGYWKQCPQYTEDELETFTSEKVTNFDMTTMSTKTADRTSEANKENEVETVTNTSDYAYNNDYTTTVSAPKADIISENKGIDDTKFEAPTYNVTTLPAPTTDDTSRADRDFGIESVKNVTELPNTIKDTTMAAHTSINVSQTDGYNESETFLIPAKVVHQDTMILSAPKTENTSKISKRDDAGIDSSHNKENLTTVEDYEYDYYDDHNDFLHLPDECLSVINQYLKYFKKGKEEIEKVLGEENRNRLLVVVVIQFLDKKEPKLYNIKEIVHELMKCQHDASIRDEKENVNICQKILEIIKTYHFPTKDLFSMFEEFYKEKQAIN